MTCLSSATVSLFILLSFFFESLGTSGLISCTIKKKVLHVNKEDLAHSVSLSERMEGFKPHRCRRCLSSHPQIPFSAARSSPASLPSRAPSPSLSSHRQSARKVTEGLHYCKIKANAIIELRVTEINITLSQQCSAVTLNASKILLKKMKLGS